MTAASDAAGPKDNTIAPGTTDLADKTARPDLTDPADGIGPADTAAPLDGNALAGDLGEIFAVDITTATFTCAGCRHGFVMAALRVWGDEFSRVGRCPHCDDVILRLINAPARAFLDLRGALRLSVPLPAN